MKHVEPLMNGGIINSVTRLHLCWLFLLNHTTMHGSMNIKFMGCFEIFLITERLDCCVPVSGYGERSSPLIVLITIERVVRIYGVHFACTLILAGR